MLLKISLSLDVWTLSNYYAFLEIVAHYITNNGHCGKKMLPVFHLLTNYLLEGLLIDFCKLIGPHSGENMADIVWSTLELYGIQNKVRLPCYKLQQDC